MIDYTRKAKIKDSNEWVIGYHVYVDYLDKHYILVSEKTHDGFSGMLAMKQYEVDGDTICNPTGLSDKNGNKIWENDIVSCGGYLAVTWKEEFASFCLSKKGWMYQHFFGEAVNGCDCKVIGNIFDNADLLKGE